MRPRSPGWQSAEMPQLVRYGVNIRQKYGAAKRQTDVYTAFDGQESECRGAKEGESDVRPHFPCLTLLPLPRPRLFNMLLAAAIETTAGPTIFK